MLNLPFCRISGFLVSGRAETKGGEDNYHDVIRTGGKSSYV
jgi:hypothetical protein